METNNLELFLQNNGKVPVDLFNAATHQCILTEIAFSVCKELRSKDKLMEIKNKIRNLGEKNSVRILLNKYSLTDVEFDYAFNIIINFIHKNDERNSDIQKYKPSIYNRQNGLCNSCLKKISIEHGRIDHIIPHCYVGDRLNSVDSLQILCSDCNKKKSNDAWFPIHYYIVNGKMPFYIELNNPHK
ncbi:MAG: hypothetical protein GX137_06620 [Thermoplasmatales archaeon]|nr:hypothetical protein [Thermoplasmatales archaeon]